MRDIAQWLLQKDDFVVVGHVQPDGDSYGSCLALAMALRALGKRAFVAAPPLPHMFRFLTGQNLIYQKENMPFQPKNIVHVDTAAPDRVGVVFDEEMPAALIDHHETNVGFDDVRHIDGGASSAGELVMALLQEMNIAISSDMAVCLYTAIASDTGSFQFSGTTGRCMRQAAELIDSGLDIGKISTAIFRSRTLARTKLLGEVLHAMELSEDGRIAVAVVDKEMMARCSAVHADMEGIVNYLSEIDSVKAAALLEVRDGDVKVSMRSQEWIDVAAIAKALGGGGHKSAAGVTLKGTTQEAKQEIFARFRKAVG